MNWSPSMRENRRCRARQLDWIDNPVLAFKLVCDGNELLTNRFVTARKPHSCELCTGPIAKGERIRAESRRSEDGRHIKTRRVCALCCEAISDLPAKIAHPLSPVFGRLLGNPALGNPNRRKGS